MTTYTVIFKLNLTEDNINALHCFIITANKSWGREGMFNNIGLKFDRIQIAEKKTTYHHLLRHTGSYFHFY
jgi:hypothetical protein